MKFAYADPPYYGQAKKHYSDHPDHAVYDTLEGHQALIDHLVDEYPDGWALSMGSVNLQTLLPLCPSGVRVLAWCKPFCSFKPNVGLAYSWEPVVFSGGRRIERDDLTVKDHLNESITLQRGLTGAKPFKFCRWILRCLNFQPGDTIDDLFPGTGSMASALAYERPKTIAMFIEATP